MAFGMRSTQLSESLNSDLKDYLRPNMDITRFFYHFERVVKDKRYKKKEAEYSCRQKLPKIKMKNSPMLNQVAQVYTPSIFDLFQEEYDHFQATFLKSKDETQPTYEYVVAIVGKDRDYKVFANRVDKTVSCDCRKFETFGILCCHALKVLDAMDIKLIPEKYIMKRWTREAMSEIVQDLRGTIIQNDPRLQISDRYRLLCPSYVKLISRGSVCEEACAFLVNEILRLSKVVEDICKKSATSCEDIGTDMQMITNEDMHGNNCSPSSLGINVNCLKKTNNSKGKNNKKRYRSWHEKLGCIGESTSNKKRAKVKAVAINNTPHIISEKNNLSQGAGSTYYVGFESGPRPHDFDQTYTDLLLNGIRTNNGHVFVGESQVYPSSN